MQSESDNAVEGVSQEARDQWSASVDVLESVACSPLLDAVDGDVCGVWAMAPAGSARFVSTLHNNCATCVARWAVLIGIVDTVFHLLHFLAATSCILQPLPTSTYHISFHAIALNMSRIKKSTMPYCTRRNI